MPTPEPQERVAGPDLCGAGKAMKQTAKTSAELGRPDAPALGADAPSVVASGTEETRVSNAAETHWSQASASALQEPVPKQPTERDESASSQGAASASIDTIGEVAYHDAVGGVDTDRGPVMDAVYNGPVTEGHRTGEAANARDESETAKSSSTRNR